MAEGARDVLSDTSLGGIVVALDGAPLAPFEVCVGGHPRPRDDAPLVAERVMEHVAAARGSVVALVSGGGSAMLERPLDGFSIARVGALASSLLERGAPIEDVNVVRMALSSVKGGRLAALARGPLVSLVVSDLDDSDSANLHLVASGPTVAPPTPRPIGDVFAILERHRRGEADVLFLAPDERRALERETFARADGPHAHAHEAVRLVSNVDARRAVLATLGPDLRDRGFVMRGEARDWPSSDADIARGRWVAGGETTVHVRGGGRGGRCHELIAAIIALDIEGRFVAFGTDGLDGSSGSAGAFVGERATRTVSPSAARAALDANDTAPLFADHGLSLVSRPTGTNVADVLVRLG